MFFGFFRTAFGRFIKPFVRHLTSGLTKELLALASEYVEVAGSHPDLHTNAGRRVWVAEKLKARLGGSAKDVFINLAIELAVSRLKAK